MVAYYLLMGLLTFVPLLWLALALRRGGQDREE